MSSKCEKHSGKLAAVIKDAGQEFQSEIEQVQLDAEKKSEEFQEDTPEGPEVALGFDLEFGVEKQKLTLHLPQFRIENRKLGSLHVPEVSIKQEKIIFHTPSTRMVRRVVGKHPEVICKFQGIRTKCRTVWKDIIADVPEVFMEEQRIVMGIPVITMDQQDIIVGMPVMEFKPTTLEFNTPTVTIKNVKVEISEKKKKAEAFQSEVKQRVEDEKAEFRADLMMRAEPEHTALFACIRDEAKAAQDTQLALFKSAQKSIDEQLRILREHDVPSDQEVYKTLERQRAQIVADMEKAKAQFEQVFSKIAEEQKNSWRAIVKSFQA